MDVWMKYVKVESETYLEEIISKAHIAKYRGVIGAQCDRNTIVQQNRQWVHRHRRC